MDSPITRRRALAGLLVAAGASRLRSQPRAVEIDARGEIGTIRPELHGHFAEHLGTCTYQGLWVGKNSTIPNINGYRKAAVEYLRELGVPVLRWPGGCFADDYHWRDGIGPYEKRPKTVNLWWGKYTEDNSFGTHEFMGLCKLIGAEPYFAGNVGSGTPAELRDWVEYCNYPSGSTLSDERIRNGAAQPFGIKYWGIGNENWGCGGSMHGDEYSQKYRQYATFVQSRPSEPLFLIACGPNGNNADWTKSFMDGIRGQRRLPQGYAMHFYSRGRNLATKFTVDNMYQQFSSFPRVEQAVQEQRALLDKYDTQRRIGLMVDEWGVWDEMDPEEEKRYGRLWQQITMRSAVAAALGLNVFHRQADKLYMCNIAQIVNVLHSMLLTDGDKCVRTSTYYAFELLKPHRGKTALKLSSPEDALSVSASRKDKDLAVTLVNSKHDAPFTVNCNIGGASVTAAKARLIHHADLNACNTFDKPDTITPRDHDVTASGATLKIELPPLSVATITATLS